MKSKIAITGRVRICIQKAKELKLKNKIVLDIGCSDGLMASYLLLQNPKEYIGIDPNAQAIKKARKNLPNAKFFEGFASNLPVDKSTVDIVLAFDVIEHVPKGTERAMLKDIYNVLKRDGVLLLSTPNWNWLTNFLDPAWYLGHRHYKPKSLEEMLKSAGFKKFEIEVRGGLRSSIYVIWFYVAKWILRRNNPRNYFLENLDDRQYDQRGIHTIFIKAYK